MIEAVRRRRTTRAAVFLLVACAALAAFTASARPASAHAVLESSTPANGAVVQHSPPEVLLRYSESVTLPPNAVVVLDSNKHRVDKGDAHAGPTPDTVVIGLRPNLPRGSYLVAWHVISADSHPVQGGVVFSVGAPGPAASLSAANHSGRVLRWKVIDDVLRGIAFATVLFAGGATVFITWIHPEAERSRRRRAVVLTACGAGIVAFILQVPVLAAQATDGGLGALAQSGVLSDTLGDGVGWSVLAGVVALLVFGLVWRLHTTAATRAAAVLGVAATAASFVLIGHTRSTSPAWLVVLAELCHVTAAMIWFGGLAMLAVELRRWRRDGAAVVHAAGVVRRFSGWATVAILTVLVAGSVLAWLEVRSLHALTTTAYGRLLIVKVSIVAVAALIGAYNHYRLVPGVAAVEGSAPRWRRLATTVRSEALLLVVVIGITAVLGNLVPARTAAGTNKVFTGSAPFGDGSINVVVDPARVGPNDIHLYVLDREGRQVPSTRSIVVNLSLASSGISGLQKVPQVAGPGHYQVTGVAIPLPGTWTLEITSAVNEFSNDNVIFKVPIQP